MGICIMVRRAAGTRESSASAVEDVCMILRGGPRGSSQRGRREQGAGSREQGAGSREK